MKMPRIVLSLFAVASTLATFSATAQEYRIVRVADSITNPELGNLNTALATPVIEGDYVVFRTLNSNNTVVANIWSWNRRTTEFKKLVDLSMAAPGGTGNFTDLGAGMGGPILRDGIVVFGARDSSTPAPPVSNMGIFSVPVTGGAIQRVANYNSPVPGGIGNFFNFSPTSQHTGVFSYSDGTVGFECDFGGEPIGNSGIYQSGIGGDNMLPIADSLHGIGDPGVNQIKNFTHIDVNGGRAAFIGGTVFGFNSIFSTSLPATLPVYNEVISIPGTTLPGATSGFQFVTPSVRIYGDHIFFIALDGVNGITNNRRTLYEIPWTGGTPTKVLSNFDTLEGLSSIEQSSINSYDINPNHLLIRAKAPGSTPFQGLYLFDRSARTFKRILNLEQTILNRSFSAIGEVQPGAITEDSSSAVIALGGSALFVGPFGYIVMLTTEPEDVAPPQPTATPPAITPPAADPVGTALEQGTLVLADARKPLPAKPSRNASKAKKAAVRAKRAAITAARKSLTQILATLTQAEKTSGETLRATYPNLTKKNLSQLQKFKKAGSSANSTAREAKAAWKSFTTLLAKVRQGV